MNRYSLNSEEMKTLIKPEVSALAKRGNVTWEEWESLRMNSYERYVLIPHLTLNALTKLGEQHLHHCSFLTHIPATYDELILHVIFPCLLQRLNEVQNSQKSPTKETKLPGDKGNRTP